MEPGLDPVAISILPGRDLASEHISRLVDRRGVARIAQVLGAAQSAQTAANDRDRFLLVLRLQLIIEARRRRGRVAVVLRVLEAGRLGAPCCWCECCSAQLPRGGASAASLSVQCVSVQSMRVSVCNSSYAIDDMELCLIAHVHRMQSYDLCPHQ